MAPVLGFDRDTTTSMLGLIHGHDTPGLEILFKTEKPAERFLDFDTDVLPRERGRTSLIQQWA
jgi:hypothetical protein